MLNIRWIPPDGRVNGNLKSDIPGKGKGRV